MNHAWRLDHSGLLETRRRIAEAVEQPRAAAEQPGGDRNVDFAHQARRIACSSSRSALLSTGFVNPDGTVATVVMNRGDKEVKYNLWVAGNAAEVTSLPHSIQTLVF
jgi:hypothetical protein